MTDRVYRGEIYYIAPNETTGSEQQSGRPAVIVSNDIGNEHSNVVEVVYLTTQEKKPMPTHVLICSMQKVSTALCEQIHSVSKSRIGSYAGQATESEMADINEALAVSLGIGLEKTNKAVEKWARAYVEDVKAPVTPPAPAVKDENLTIAITERDLYKALYEKIYEDLIRRISK